MPVSDFDSGVSSVDIGVVFVLFFCSVTFFSWVLSDLRGPKANQASVFFQEAIGLLYMFSLL